MPPPTLNSEEPGNPRQGRETTTVPRPYHIPRTYDCVSERAGTLLIGLGCKMTSGR